MDWYYYLIIGIVLAIIFYFITAFLIYRKVFVKFKNSKKVLVDQESPFYAESFTWFQNIPKDDVYIHSYDNIKLHGYYLPPLDQKTNNLAIVIHGYQSKATDMIIIAKLYSDLGFKVLMIDLRGHGLSEGNFTSMGYYEKYDLKKWINHALRSYGSNSKILLHGVSMGAAMSMMVTEFPEKKNLEFLVLDSGYTNFAKSFAESMKPSILRILIPGISLMTYLRHRFFLNKISPLKAIKSSRIPFLIIHGDKDRPVPLKQANQLFASSPIENKNILIIEGAPHAKGFEINKDLVTETIIDNIAKPFNIKKANIKFSTKSTNN